MDADGVLDGVGFALGVAEHGVEVPDLAEAIAAELQRRGHVPESPLAHVERRAPVVLGARVAVGHDHLRERHPVRHRPHAPAVLVTDGVEHQPLAVVEAHPHRPLLPPDLVSVEHEGRSLGLGDLQRLRLFAHGHRHVLGKVLAHYVRLLHPEGVLYLQKLHPVEVYDELEAVYRVGVGVGVFVIPVPDVRPADPHAPVPVCDERAPVSPDVEEHLVEVRDAAGGERLHDPRVLAQCHVALVELVGRDVGLLARVMLPRYDAVIGERDHRLVGLAVLAVPADHPRFARDRVSRRKAPNHVFRRLLQLDGGEAPSSV